MVFVIQGREELLTFTSLRGACWSHTSKNMRPPFQSKFSSHIAVKVRPTVGFVKKSVYFNLIGQIHCNSLQDHKWRWNSRFWWRMWGFSELRLRLRLRLRLSKKIATLSDWLKNRAPVYQPMRRKTKTNRDLHARFFQRLWASYMKLLRNTLFASAVIGRSNHFGICFTTLNWKPL